MRVPISVMTATFVCASLIGMAAPSAQRPPPAIAYTGPGDSPVERAIRDRLIAFAQKRGLGLYDLADQKPATASRAPELAGAIGEYEAFRYGETIKRLDELEARAIAEGGAGLTRRELADLYIYRAMSKSELTDPAGARDDLVRAASIFDAYKLDAVRFRPSLRAAFERARADVVKEPEASLRLELPRGCTVWLDGQRESRTVAPVRRGLHFVRAVCAGYLPYATTVAVDSAEAAVKPTLEPRQSERDIAITANKSAAWLIWVNASRLAPGRVDIELIDMSTKKQQREWSLSIDANSDVIKIEDTLISLIDTEFSAPVPPPVVITRPSKTRWYERKWVWAAVGAAVATAIIVPFALRDTEATGFGATIEGLP